LSVSIPFTLPRHVVPEYGTEIESVPIVAVPVNEIAHEVRPGPVAFPSALQLSEVGEVNAPWAAPVNLRSPGQLAVNDPFAVVPVCSVTFHLKSVHVLGVGMSVDDVQLPSSELIPAAVGSVEELRCSKPAHPIAALAATAMMVVRIEFFMTLANR
jgi:hypothetical protein